MISCNSVKRLDDLLSGESQCALSRCHQDPQELERKLWSQYLASFISLEYMELGGEKKPQISFCSIILACIFL